MTDRASYETAVRRLADALGEDTEDILRRYEASVRGAEFPGPDCLAVEEIEAAALGEELSEARQEHIRECPGCASAVAAARPDGRKRELFLQAVRSAREGEAPARFEAEETREPAAARSTKALVTS